jgi:hypothetical protein
MTGGVDFTTFSVRSGVIVGYAVALGLNAARTALVLDINSIPEPSTWALLLTSAAVLAVLRRRR